MIKLGEIFIVEDDEFAAFMIQHLVKSLDVFEKVTILENGKVAYDEIIARIEQKRSLPEYILLDLNMPIWDGWQFYDAFCKHPEHHNTTIYIVTSSIDQEDFERAKANGLENRFLNKPLKLETLKKIFNQG